MLLRSRLGKIVVAKFWAPILCAGVSLLILDEGFTGPHCLLALPFLVGALFAASLAIIELRDGVLRCKRLIGWTTIPKSEIVNIRIEWPPIIGSLRLKRFLFPWGRLYFVLDSNIDSNPFKEGTYPLLQSILKEIPTHHDAARTVSDRRPGKRANLFSVVGSGVAGALLYAWTRVLSPNLGAGEEETRVTHLHEPAWIKSQWEVIQLLKSPGLVLPLFVIFCFLTVRRYRQPDAWIFAFLAGVSLPYVLIRWL